MYNYVKYITFADLLQYPEIYWNIFNISQYFGSLCWLIAISGIVEIYCNILPFFCCQSHLEASRMLPVATPEKIKGNKSLLVSKYDIMATQENSKGNLEYLIINI